MGKASARGTKLIKIAKIASPTTMAMIDGAGTITATFV